MAKTIRSFAKINCPQIFHMQDLWTIYFFEFCIFFPDSQVQKFHTPGERYLAMCRMYQPAMWIPIDQLRMVYYNIANDRKNT